LILTATRSGETRGAVWTEIDQANALWVIPAKRMKVKKRRVDHIVPLSTRCLEILEEARSLTDTGGLIFHGRMPGEQISDMTFTKVLRDMGVADKVTAHGFRKDLGGRNQPVQRRGGRGSIGAPHQGQGRSRLPQDVLPAGACAADATVG
jgi:integrase